MARSPSVAMLDLETSDGHLGRVGAARRGPSGSTPKWSKGQRETAGRLELEPCEPMLRRQVFFCYEHLQKDLDKLHEQLHREIAAAVRQEVAVVDHRLADSKRETAVEVWEVFEHNLSPLRDGLSELREEVEAQAKRLQESVQKNQMQRQRAMDTLGAHDAAQEAAEEDCGGVQMMGLMPTIAQWHCVRDPHWRRLCGGCSKAAYTRTCRSFEGMVQCGRRPPPADTLSMVPAVVRRDPGISSRPHLRRSMEAWWGGALWDPREAGKDFLGDFTHIGSTLGVLEHNHAQAGRNEPLVSCTLAGDVAGMEWLLSAGANATHALHVALRAAAEPSTVRLLAASSPDLDAQLPEPVVLAWTRGVCEACEAPRRPRTLDNAYERLDALLDAGADINASGVSGETSLHVVARYLRLRFELSEEQAATGRAVSSARSRQWSTTSSERELQLAWHNLVVRGADASMPDYEGITPLEHLSRSQCRQLLAAKRNTYGMRRYKSAG